MLKNKTKNLGFTLIELLVVVSIMVLLAGVFILDLKGKSSERNLGLASALLVSNIKKAQSYTLSGRSVYNELPYYYVVQFDANSNGINNSYSLLGISNVPNIPKVIFLEKINLPPNVIISKIAVTRSAQTQIIPSCAVLAFKLPYAKMYSSVLASGQNCQFNYPYDIVNSIKDPYNNILTYITNATNNSDYGANNYDVSTDFILDITLKDTQKNLERIIEVNGTTGNVTAL